MELGLRVSLELDERHRRRGRHPRSAAPGRRPLAAAGRSLARVPQRAAGRRGRRRARRASTCARCPPRTSRSCPSCPAEGVLSVPADAFVDTIARVARAASRDETRPHLTGVLVTAEGDVLRMVATDSYRLSVKEAKLDQALPSGLEANVPARTLQELARIATAAEAETIGVAALENQVIFSVADVVLSSRLVEGRFPNYQQLLPEAYEHELRVSRDGAARRRSPRRAAGAEERAAAAALLRGRARGLRPDAGRRRGERVAADSVRWRTAGDRLQSGVLPRGTRERASPRSCC